jgi:hypothetical protein
MQIQLKQNEIVAAIKQYVAQQGINLTGRKVEVTFTAGRKESGLSADVDITDDVPTSEVVTLVPRAAEPDPAPAEAEAAPAAPTKASSLFG